MVPGEIERMISLLEERTDDFRTLAVEAAHNEVAHKRAYAVELLKAREGTVAEREATASLKCSDEYSLRRASEASRDACLEAMRSLRAQLSALQTLARMEYDQSSSP